MRYGFLIEIGDASFRGEASAGGIAALFLPPLDAGVKRLASGAPLVPDFTILPAEFEAAGHVRSFGVFLSDLLSGRPPSAGPPADLSGTSDFTRLVLRAACRIPWGAVSSYSSVAAGAGRTGAARAAGSALGRNPVPLLVPCHRVIRSDGEAGGWSGLPGWKEWLLALESGGRLD